MSCDVLDDGLCVGDITSVVRVLGAEYDWMRAESIRKKRNV